MTERQAKNKITQNNQQFHILNNFQEIVAYWWPQNLTAITTRDMNFDKYAFMNVKIKLKLTCQMGSMLVPWLNHII